MIDTGEWMIVVLRGLSGLLLLSCVGVPALVMIERRFGQTGDLANPFVDGLKLLGKAVPATATADRLAHRLTPLLELALALGVCGLIPVGERIAAKDRLIELRLADPGLVYLLALVGLCAFVPLLAARATLDPLGSIGGVRGASCRVSYWLCMSLAGLGVILADGAQELREIVGHQTGAFGPLPGWHLWEQPLGCVVFFICAIAWSGTAPFDTERAEEELGGGYRNGYGGVSLLLLTLAGYIRQIAAAALVVVLYAGGWQVPSAIASSLDSPWMELSGVAVFAAKVGLVLCAFCWLGWTLPRLSYTRGMRLAWRVLLPAAAFNLLLTSLLIAVDF